MSLLPFFDWCQQTALALAIRNSVWAAPVIDITHLIGLVMLFGPVFILNLRLLGIGITSQSAPELAAALRPWFWRGIAVSFASGTCFFFANAIKAYNVPPFYIKMAFLSIGLALQTTLVPAATHWGGIRARMTGALSLVVWFIVPIAGFWIELY